MDKNSAQTHEGNSSKFQQLRPASQDQLKLEPRRNEPQNRRPKRGRS